MATIAGTISLASGSSDEPAFSTAGNAIEHRCRRSGLTVIGVVRIDNGVELRRSLGLERSVPDGEVLVAAYCKWGSACAVEIIGDFAFAIWDEGSRRLYVARDVFGVRPLYYGCKPGRVLAFGSEMASVLEHNEFTRSVNETALADLFEGRFEDHHTTLYRDVLRLPAAHHLIADAERVRIERYWEFDRSRELVLSSDREYEEGYRAHLFEAVRCRLPESRSVGAMLSGGLDSSSVAGIAGELLADAGRGPLPTFSNLFSDTPASDERDYIEAVLRSHRFSPHFNEGGQHDPLGSLDELLRIQGVPFFGANFFLVAALGRQASDAGVGVLLDGFGGDSTTSHGWYRLRELARDLRWVHLQSELRAFGSDLGLPWPRAYAGLVWRYGLKSRAASGPFRALRPYIRKRHPRSGSLLNPDFAAHVVSATAGRAAPLVRPMLSARDRHLEEMTNPVMPAAAEITDRIADSIGIEFRYPFLDRRLAEYCLALPSDQKLRDGWTRSIARRSLAGVLPEEVRWRRNKADLSHNLIHLLQTRSRNTLERAIHVDPGPLASVVDMGVLRAALARLDSGQAGPEDAQMLWVAAITHRWLAHVGGGVAP